MAPRNLPEIYSTAQLQGNIRMRLKCMQDASGTHTRRVRASAKPRDKAAARHTRVPRPFFARRGRIRNACETGLKRVQTLPWS